MIKNYAVLSYFQSVILTPWPCSLLRGFICEFLPMKTASSSGWNKNVILKTITSGFGRPYILSHFALFLKIQMFHSIGPEANFGWI